MGVLTNMHSILSDALAVAASTQPGKIGWHSFLSPLLPLLAKLLIALGGLSFIVDAAGEERLKRAEERYRQAQQEIREGGEEEREARSQKSIRGWLKRRQAESVTGMKLHHIDWYMFRPAWVRPTAVALASVAGAATLLALCLGSRPLLLASSLSLPVIYVAYRWGISLGLSTASLATGQAVTGLKNGGRRLKAVAGACICFGSLLDLFDVLFKVGNG